MAYLHSTDKNSNKDLYIKEALELYDTTRMMVNILKQAS